MSGSGAGRGGRGAALLEALRAKGLDKPGTQTQDESAGASGRAHPTLASYPGPVPTGGRGRSSLSLLAMLPTLNARSQEVLPHSQGTEEAAAAAVRPVGRGRSAVLSRPVGRASNLGTPEPPQEIVTASRSPEATPLRKPPVTVPSRRPPEAAPTRSFSQMSLEEPPPSQQRPPVIRKGESGKTVKATANYVPLILEPGKGVYEYEVRFIPELDAKKLRFQMLNKHLDALGGVKTFDGVTLYLPIKLPDKMTVFECSHPIDETNVTMTIKFKRKNTMGECIHLYNVLFRRIMNVLELARIGRQHFNPRGSHLIPQHRLEVWPGYVTAVDEFEGGIQLCCDSSHRVLRMQTVLQLIEECVAKYPRSFKDEMQKSLIGSSVLTRYNNKTYRVDDMTWDQTPSSTFPTYSGEKISYITYYQKQYDIDIKDPNQPLLISRLKTKIRGQEPTERMVCLMPELCYTTGLTDEMRADFRVMKDIAIYTRITPNQRQAALKKFISSINSSPKAQALLADWGLRLAPKPVDLLARVLPPEDIFFGKNALHKGTVTADWGGAATRSHVLTAKDIQCWLLIHTQRDTRFANDFATMMKKVGPQMGIQVCDPRMCPLRDDRTESYLRCMRENINPTLQVVVLICPTARDDRYSAIKKLCCSEIPIASQVINSRTLSKPDKVRSVVQKIALQINCKLGGTLWAVKIPFDNCMVCGIDTYHSTTGRGRSVGGFVASLNQPFTRWFSKVCFQGPQEELIGGMKTCFISALKRYYESNHKFPDRVFIFRDGVGDGQLKTTLEHEVPQFESVFSLINPNYKPTLTVVVCQKRINTRIFASLNGNGGELSNPEPGTIVDHTVTRRDWYDFFLVSQHVRQGTVSPTHYVVIHDSGNMKTDHVQRLTYKLCHLYYNWPGTVRVPAPCQYAHKLAYLVGQNINRDPSDVLQDKLFFL